MPPKKSLQSKRKTDGANYPAKRPRRASTVSRHNKKAAPPHSAAHSEIATRQPPSSAEQPMGPAEKQPTLTPDLIDQLVARVADEVTRHISMTSLLVPLHQAYLINHQSLEGYKLVAFQMQLANVPSKSPLMQLVLWSKKQWYLRSCQLQV